jgi:hypothetical protein
MNPRLFLCLALVLSVGLLGISSNSGPQVPMGTPAPTSTSPASENGRSLSVSIALLDSPFNSEPYVDIHTNCHFHVVISNISTNTQYLLKEGSSWGWQTLSFELVDEKGNKYLIQRRPAAWTDNAPVYWILKPGEHYVRDICFAQIYQGTNSWQGFPDELNIGGSLKVRMKAIFETTTDKSFEGAPLWHGRIESQPVICRIRDIRSIPVALSPYGE